jgi:predicted acetyltransferase
VTITGLDVRTITDDDVPAWCTALNTGFLRAGGARDAEMRRPSLYLDRTWAGHDGDRIVATLRSFPAALTVPGGGAVDVSAVTSVTTTSTHRRRGLASRLIAADLAASADRGEAAAVLIAAEWRIYGRYGYGPATEHQQITVEAAAARFREPPQGTVEYVDRDTARSAATGLYDRFRKSRPGAMTRGDWFLDLDFGVLRYPTRPAPPDLLYALARDPDGGPVGVVGYEAEERYDGRRPDYLANVRRMISADPVGEALLWHHLVNLDLTTRVVAADRPVDESLPWLLTDARHVSAGSRADFLWVRPLDVAALLAARRYPVTGTVVVEVVDPAGPAAGRYALDGGPDGASCTRTDASADLTVDVATLGTVYLGGYPLRTLAGAGLVDEHRPGAVDRADPLFRSPVTPWCSGWF